MTPRIGLYYPFIHSQDDEWVKLAALYWARMARIVPPGYATHDSPVVKALGEEFVLDVSPVGSATALNERFVRVLTAHADKLRARYGVEQAAAWKPDPVTLQRMEGAQVPLENIETGFAYLHAGKLHPELHDQLVDAGLAVPTRGDNPSWIGVHPTVARIYMTALANELASRHGGSTRRLRPVTDDAFDHLAVSGWTFERLSAALLEEPGLAESETTELEPSVALAFVAIETVVPKDLSSVPVRRIVEVREKYRSELTQFITNIETIGEQLGSLWGVEEPDLVKAELQVAYEEKIKPQLDVLKHDLRLFKIETVASAADIKVTAPPALSSVAGGLGMGVNPVLAAGAGIAIGGASLISGRHVRAAQLTRSSPAAYLLRLEEGLRPSTLIERIREGLRRFVSRP
jgi:hypothetical protein